MFKDLRDAIKNVLLNASKIPHSDLTETHEVETDYLQVLQAEYNIYFVEPDDEQLEVI